MVGCSKGYNPTLNYWGVKIKSRNTEKLEIIMRGCKKHE